MRDDTALERMTGPMPLTDSEALAEMRKMLAVLGRLCAQRGIVEMVELVERVDGHAAEMLRQKTN